MRGTRRSSRPRAMPYSASSGSSSRTSSSAPSPTRRRMTTLQSEKGLAFVFLSAVYVFAVGVRMAQRVGAEHDRTREGNRRPTGAWVPVLVFVALSLVLGGTGFLLHSQSADAERSHALASLSISADAKASRIAAWLDDLKSEARFLATNSEARRALALPKGEGRGTALATFRYELERYRAGLPDPVRRRPRRRRRSVRHGRRARGDRAARPGGPVEGAGAGRAGDRRAEDGTRRPSGPEDRGGGAGSRRNACARRIRRDRARRRGAARRAAGAVARLEADQGDGDRSPRRRRGRLPFRDEERTRRERSASDVFRPPGTSSPLGPSGARWRWSRGSTTWGCPSSARPATFPGTDWVLVVKVTEEEVLGPFRRRLVLSALFLVALLLAAAAVTRIWWNAVRARLAGAGNESWRLSGTR